MTKLVIDNITSGYNLSKINENFQKIQNEFQMRVLYRNNPVGEPNQLFTDIDLNGKNLLNVNGIDVQSFTVGGAPLDKEVLEDISQNMATLLLIPALAEQVRDDSIQVEGNTFIVQTLAAQVELTAISVASDKTDAQGYAQTAIEARDDAIASATSTAVLLANAGSMLGINFGAFTLNDGELTVTHLTTTEPSLVDGELILTYETLEV